MRESIRASPQRLAFLSGRSYRKQENLTFLLSNIHANGFTGVEVFPVAMGEATSVRPFDGDGVIASLTLQCHGWLPSFSRLVTVTSLDNLFAARWSEQRLFFKVDVIGAKWKS
jgi:hypothetical protein